MALLTYWIIKHQSHGYFNRWGYDPDTGRWRPFFIWPEPQSDWRKVKRFYIRRKAEQELLKLLPVVGDCYLVMVPSGS